MKAPSVAKKEIKKAVAKRQKAELKGSPKKKMKATKQEDTSLEAVEKPPSASAADKPKEKKEGKLSKGRQLQKDVKKVDLSTISFEDCGVEEKVVQQAIEDVRVLEGKKKLQEDEEKENILYMQVGRMESTKKLRRPVKINIFLPNPVTNESTKVLLITKDSQDNKDIPSDKAETLHYYKDMLAKSGAAKRISKVVTLKQLKTQYKGFDKRRKLANESNVVLCDKRVLFHAPLFMGKHFLTKGKFPIPVNLQAKKLLPEVERCLRCEVLLMPMTGTCGLMKIGRLDQSNEEILENVKLAFRVMKANFPGGWANIKALHLKTKMSKAVPLYIHLRPNEKKKEKKTEAAVKATKTESAVKAKKTESAVKAKKTESAVKAKKNIKKKKAVASAKK